MREQNDSNNRYAEFEQRPKFNPMILVFGLLILLGVVMFAPISNKRSYTDTTQVRLMDAVLVEFEWTAEYSLPLTTKPQERTRYERLVRQIMNQGINEAVRGCFKSADLYGANIDTIQYSLYTLADFEPLVPKLDTLYITSMQFEEQFMLMIRSLHEAKVNRVQDSLAFEAHKIRAEHEFEFMGLEQKRDSMRLISRAEIQRAELKMELERQLGNAKKARFKLEKSLQNDK